MRLRFFLKHPVMLLFVGAMGMAVFLGGGIAQDGRGGADDLAVSVLDIPPEKATVVEETSPTLENTAAEPVGNEELQVAGTGGNGSQEAAAEEAGKDKPEVLVHTVMRGETLWDIAKVYGIDVTTLVVANDLVDIDRIRVGQELKVLNVEGALHTVQRGESLWDIARMYRVDMDEIVEANDLADPTRLQVQQELVIPGAQAVAHALRREALLSTDGKLLRNFDWPLRGRLTSRFGPRWGRLHAGIDVAVPIGTPIRAAANGRVSYSGYNGGYGNLVTVDHGNGIETRYAHNNRNVVNRGERVARGQIIAYSGNTGNSTGPHLHFEIRRNGRALDPLPYLK